MGTGTSSSMLVPLARAELSWPPGHQQVGLEVKFHKRKPGGIDTHRNSLPNSEPPTQLRPIPRVCGFQLTRLPLLTFPKLFQPFILRAHVSTFISHRCISICSLQIEVLHKTERQRGQYTICPPPTAQRQEHRARN